MPAMSAPGCVVWTLGNPAIGNAVALEGGAGGFLRISEMNGIGESPVV